MAVWVCLVLCARPAAAERSAAEASAAEPSAAELQAARKLFRSATADEEQGRWADALKTLRQIEAIKVTAGVLFHVAVCEQNLGRYVEALDDLGRAEELAQTSGDDAVLELIPERRREIEAALASLKIDLIGDDGLVSVTLDGEVLPRVTLQSDIPLNPGEHVLEVRRSGQPAQRRTVQLRSGQRHGERFDVSRAPLPAHTQQHEQERAEHASGSNVARRIVIYTGYALALSGTGMGIYFLVDAGSKQDAAERARNDVQSALQSLDSSGMPVSGAPCAPPFNVAVSSDVDRRTACVDLSNALDDRDRARTLAVWSFAIAGVGALGGTAALLFWPESDRDTALRIAPTLGGAVLSGRF